MKTKTNKNGDSLLNNGDAVNLTLTNNGKRQANPKDKSERQKNANNRPTQKSANAKNTQKTHPMSQKSASGAQKNKQKPTQNSTQKPSQKSTQKPAQNSNSQPKQTVRNAKPKSKLKVMFLGGVGEIGKNMTVFEYGDSIVVLDAGMTFPGVDMPGVDVVIPDVSYLVENRARIRGILLTHGHEDHIGALPYVIEKLGGKVDVYGTKMTLALAENKLIERNVFDKVNFVTVNDKSVVTLGDFTAEFIHVSHSVAGSTAICLRTPVGTVLHTGDFKVDYTPLDRKSVV